ncbi:MAG: hypothetical protein MUP44_03355 [Anaerolineales bacterium]|nr:hypothetical protein [Anaerolineales bacterium]
MVLYDIAHLLPYRREFAPIHSRSVRGDDEATLVEDCLSVDQLGEFWDVLMPLCVFKYSSHSRNDDPLSFFNRNALTANASSARLLNETHSDLLSFNELPTDSIFVSPRLWTVNPYFRLRTSGCARDEQRLSFPASSSLANSAKLLSELSSRTI